MFLDFLINVLLKELIKLLLKHLPLLKTLAQKMYKKYLNFIMIIKNIRK